MEVIYSRTSQKDLENLPFETQKRIVEKIDLAASDPEHYFGRLKSHKKFKLRVGNYRVIVDLGDCLYVLIVDHRKRVYQRL